MLLHDALIVIPSRAEEGCNSFCSLLKFLLLFANNCIPDCRLDAIGAIGIARCFTYGGYFKRRLHDPAIAPRSGLTKQQYTDDSFQQTTINHFHEKLLKLKACFSASLCCG